VVGIGQLTNLGCPRLEEEKLVCFSSGVVRASGSPCGRTSTSTQKASGSRAVGPRAEWCLRYLEHGHQCQVAQKERLGPPTPGRRCATGAPRSTPTSPAHATRVGHKGSAFRTASHLAALSSVRAPPCFMGGGGRRRANQKPRPSAPCVLFSLSARPKEK
jgi:hypothetical protein